MINKNDMTGSQPSGETMSAISNLVRQLKSTKLVIRVSLEN